MKNFKQILADDIERQSDKIVDYDCSFYFEEGARRYADMLENALEALNYTRNAKIDQDSVRAFEGLKILSERAIAEITAQLERKD